jgi:hypothetical protein
MSLYVKNNSISKLKNAILYTAYEQTLYIGLQYIMYKTSIL